MKQRNDIYTGKDLIGYIQRNKLENIEIETCWMEGLAFSIFLDEEHTDEIEYNWSFEEDDYIRHIIWIENADDCNFTEKFISEEEALKLRGLAE